MQRPQVVAQDRITHLQLPTACGSERARARAGGSFEELVEEELQKGVVDGTGIGAGEVSLGGRCARIEGRDIHWHWLTFI